MKKHQKKPFRSGRGAPKARHTEKPRLLQALFITTHRGVLALPLLPDDPAEPTDVCLIAGKNAHPSEERLTVDGDYTAGAMSGDTVRLSVRHGKLSRVTEVLYRATESLAGILHYGIDADTEEEIPYVEPHCGKQLCDVVVVGN